MFSYHRGKGEECGRKAEDQKQKKTRVTRRVTIPDWGLRILSYLAWSCRKS
jgi:hypothetical protein